MLRCLVRTALAGAILAVGTVDGSAQSAPGTTAFRVFLKDGRALASQGESVVVGDRLVFTLMVGNPNVSGALQLISLPASAIDLTRTARYAEAVRASHYASTRGEADFIAVTAEVQRAIAQLMSIQDPKRRLALAEEAKRRLLNWSTQHYSYRADNIRELAGLFDEVIAELRAAAGESQFSFELVAGSDRTVYDPLLPPPTLKESIDLALAAAAVADTGAERIAILRAARTALGAGSDELRVGLDKRVEAEITADSAYAALGTKAIARASAARLRGDVAGVEAARAELIAGDKLLGRLRVQEVQTWLAEIGALLEATRAHKLALEHHAYVRQGLWEYERQVRPVATGLNGLTPVLEALREMRGTALERLTLATDRLKTFSDQLRRLKPPPDASDIHATLTSAVHMAIEACQRRRLAVVSANISYAREASSAAAAALLLADQARQTLRSRLNLPKIQ